MATEEKQETTFQQQVNSVVASMTQDKDGNWQIPEAALQDLPEEVVYSAKLEKRYRDTQSAYTKSRQTLKSLETTNTRLTEHMIKNATLHISDEQRADLEALRATDPEAWRQKLSEYEDESRSLTKQKITEFQEEGHKESELEERLAKVELFKQRTGVELSDDFIEENLPAKYSKDLEAGKITFDEFLIKSETYLTKTKVIAGAVKDDEEDDTPPNLGAMGGSSTPSKASKTKDIHASYKTEIF